MKTKQIQKAGNAAVADFTSYRERRIASELQRPGSLDGQSARIAATRLQALAQFDTITSPPIAFASVYLSADGTITSAAGGIEREFSPVIASALRTLTSRVQAHQWTPAPKGSAAPLLLVSIAFAAATYINQIAWLDATLSVAGHVIVGWWLDRDKYRR